MTILTPLYGFNPIGQNDSMPFTLYRKHTRLFDIDDHIFVS